MLPSEVALKDGGRLHLREAVARDARDVLDYLNTVCGETDFLTFGVGEFEMTEAEEEAFLANSQQADNMLFVLAYHDERIVGVLHFAAAGDRPRVRHCGEFGMSVRRDSWSQGVATALLGTLVDWARATGALTKINLRVRADNARAIALYERHGFVHEGTRTKEMFVDGTYYDNLLMGLELC